MRRWITALSVGVVFLAFPNDTRDTNLMVEVDSSNSVPESHENNNVLEVSLT
jgi:subtilase family serine protease